MGLNKVENMSIKEQQEHGFGKIEDNGALGGACFIL